MIDPTPKLVERVRTLGARSPLPMVATQGPTHVVRYVNPAFCILLGQDASVFVGTPLRALVHTSARPHGDVGMAVLDLVYSTGTAEFAVDLVRGFGNETVYLRCAVWPIMGQDDRPGGLLLQVSAPTREMPVDAADSGAADELRHVNQRLLVASLDAQEQAERELTLRSEAEAALHLRDEFISIAAHELRTPVTGVKISAQLALRLLEGAPPAGAWPDNDKVVQYLHGIVSGANRLVLLMNDLLDVSRMRSGDLLMRVKPIDFVELVKTAARQYSVIGGERHHVTLDLPGQPVMLAGDAGRLEQILDNLLSNAIKYSPAGGHIGVWLRLADDGILLTITDDGIGLTPGAEEIIFEPFGRAANATQHGLPGMGLGLHICRQIATAHHGRMWARSEGDGQGMTVTLWLPHA